MSRAKRSVARFSAKYPAQLMAEPSKSLPPLSDVPKGRGRPRAEEPCTSLSTWVPERTHDRLITMANQRNMSVSKFVCLILTKQIHKG